MTFGWGGRVSWSVRKDVAFHESGHAVARVLSIGRAGITNANAIRWIDMDEGNPHVSMMEMPITPDMKEAGERLGLKEGTRWTLEQRLILFTELMKIDPLEWANVRFFEAAAGAAAEAKFRQMPFDLVWMDYQCSDDRAKIPATCEMIGLKEPEAKELFDRRSKEACAAMEKADVWRAVQTLAERLPATDRMPGDIVVSIVQNALRGLCEEDASRHNPSDH